MFEIVSACELRPAGVLWQTAAGELTLTVVAKATYSLQPVESPLAEHQDDPTEYDDHWDDDEARSLRAASDLVPFKARADVILVGRAYAPGGRPARSLVARMLVAGVDKSVEVFCDRVSRQDGSLREGAGFVTMPLYWERAAGGPGTANPVGVRPDGPRDSYGMLTLPNIQPPGLHVTSHLDFIPPIGFGPIAPTWPARWDRLHARLAGWDHRRWHLGPLPADLDAGFFNAAPVDQQVDVIRPDERLVLENLDPDHPRLVTSLAKVTPCVVVEHRSSTEEVGMRCDTMVIDTERRLCTLTWRAQIPIADRRHRGRAIVTTNAAAVRWRDAPATETLETTQTPVPVSFADTSRHSSSAPPPPSVTGVARPSAPPLPGMDRTMDAPLGDSMPALPFRVGRSPLAGTVLGNQGPPGAPSAAPSIPAPQAVASPAMAPPIVAPPMVPPIVAPAMAPTIVAPAIVAPPMAPPPIVAPPLMPSAPAPVVMPAWSPMGADPYASPPSYSPAPPSYSPAPPLMFRSEPPPMFRSEPPPMVHHEPRVEEDEELEEVEEVDEQEEQEQEEQTDESDQEEWTDEEEEQPPSEPPEPEPLPLEAYPLERCAAIAATLAHKKREREEILEEQELSDDVWARLHRHWLDHVRTAEGRGQMGPSARYDDAYVGALEAGRGKMTPKEYARLLVATERGHTDETLEELDLPSNAFMRVQRVWLRRTAADTALGKEARAALDEARKA